HQRSHHARIDEEETGRDEEFWKRLSLLIGSFRTALPVRWDRRKNREHRQVSIRLRRKWKEEKHLEKDCRPAAHCIVRVAGFGAEADPARNRRESGAPIPAGKRRPHLARAAGISGDSQCRERCAQYSKERGTFEGNAGSARNRNAFLAD